MAKGLVGALRVTLGLDSAQFASGAAKAGATSGKLRKSMLGIGIAAAGVATAMASLGAAIRRSLNTADDMGKAAAKFGLPVEQLSRLKYAADLSDVSLETLGTSLGQLSKKMVAAAEGGKAQTKMFADMGVQVIDATGKMRDTEAVMQDVAEVFARMPDGAEKTALAMEIFGKSGAQMIPMLNAGKTGLQAMADEANKLGIVIDEKTAKSAEAFNDNLTRLSAAAGGLVMQLAAALAPTLERISAFAVSVAQSFSQLSPATKELIVQLGSILGVVGSAAVVFGLLSAAVSPVSLAIAGIAAGALLIYENWDGIAQWFSDIWTSIKESTEAAWTFIKETIGGAIDWVTAKWDAFVAKLQAAIQVAKDAGKAIADAMSSGPAVGVGSIIGGATPGGQLTDFYLENYGAGSGSSGSSGSSSSAGQRVAQGFADGVTAGWPAVIQAITSGNMTASEAFKQFWQIHSPSRKAAEYGHNIGAGLAEGVTEATGIVGQAVKGLNDTAAGAMKGIGDLGARIGDMFASAATNVLTGVESLSEAVGKLLQQLASMLINSAMKSLFGNLFGGFFGGIGGYARGTRSAASGLAMVGEEGPELINFRGGERVYNNRETRGMLAGGGEGGGAAQMVTQVYLDGEMILQQIDSPRGEAVIAKVNRRLGGR